MADRWGRLAVQAHVRGALKYEEFHRYEPKFLIAEEMVMEAIEDEIVAKLNRMVHEWHCSAARANVWDEGEDFEFHRKEADKTYRSVGRLELPWYNWGSTERPIEELWADFKAKEKDPEFQKYRMGLKKEMLDKIGQRKAEAEAIEKVVQLKADRRKAWDKNARLRRR